MYFKPCTINVEYSFTQGETMRRAMLSQYLTQKTLQSAPQV